MLQSCKHQRNIQYFFCIVRNVDITNVLEILWYNFEAITLSPTQTLLLLQKACQCDWGDPQTYSSTAAAWAERNCFKANQKSCSMASPDSCHSWEFAWTAARATLCLPCHYMTAASGVPQENQASITDLQPGLFECHLHLWTPFEHSVC